MKQIVKTVVLECHLIVLKGSIVIIRFEKVNVKLQTLKNFI